MPSVRNASPVKTGAVRKAWADPVDSESSEVSSPNNSSSGSSKLDMMVVRGKKVRQTFVHRGNPLQTGARDGVCLSLPCEGLEENRGGNCYHHHSPFSHGAQTSESPMPHTVTCP